MGLGQRFSPEASRLLTQLARARARTPRKVPTESVRRTSHAGLYAKQSHEH